jgi:hypothetical protein
MATERLAVRGRRPDTAVVETRPEEDAEREPVLRHQHIARQQPSPGRAEIGLIGRPGGVDHSAERRPRLRREAQIPRRVGRPRIGDRRRQDDFGIDIDTGFAAAEEADIVLENAQLQRAIGNILRPTRGGKRQHGDNGRLDSNNVGQSSPIGSSSPEMPFVIHHLLLLTVLHGSAVYTH